ncbi:hypothetical protein NQ317_013389 [Molorchus minor]|uniref:Nucleoside diphosphate kinase-like domain-containing protein n=1 Tax=Molorchus minor TaxID=1323400 RepID=A0ABQ9J7V1_9CUCU|nr:hypothetical protein NQ317_013389 [Molorchus minor]
MDDVVYVTPVDKIALLRCRCKKSPRPSDLNTFRSCGSSDLSTQRDILDDTIHYLSPATTRSDITELEGDFYRQFLEFRPPLPRPIPSYGSSISSTISCVEEPLQRTIAIIKPEAMRYKDVVLRTINESGLRIINEYELSFRDHNKEGRESTNRKPTNTRQESKRYMISIFTYQRVLHLSPEQVSEIYAQHYGSPAFPQMIVSMSIAPLLVLSLAGLDAVDKWKTLVGPYGLIREEWFYPYSVRTRFGLLGDMTEVVHASETIPEGRRENRYFYPRSILEPILVDEDKVTDYINLNLRETLLKGLTQVVRVKPIDPVLFLAEWLLLNNPYQPSFPRKSCS